MSKTEYIRAIERALREDVLPVTTETVAKDSLASCINILSALRGALDKSPAYDAVIDPNAAREVREILNSGNNSADLPDGLADDLAVRQGTLAQLRAGAQWIADHEERLQRSDIVEGLLAWERAQRTSALAVLTTNLQNSGNDDRAASVPDLAQEPLQDYFRARYGPEAKITFFRRIMGGRSRQTALFSQSGVAELPSDLVVQRDPPVHTGMPGVEIQAPVMAAANAAGMRAPKPWFVEMSRDPLGAPFMVVDRLPGNPIIDATTDYFRPPPAGLESIGVSLAEQMAILHAMPINAVESILDCSFDRENGSWDDEISRLATRLAELSSGPSIVVTVGMNWLKRYVGEIAPRWAVIHTDMLLHNLLMEGGKVTGVLDWEISHIGHPGEDLGYVRPVIEQIMPWQTFLDAYSRAGGTPLTPIESDFFGIYAAIRLLTLVQSPRRLFEGGATNDLRLAETAAAFIPQQIDRIDRIVSSVLAGERTKALP